MLATKPELLTSPFLETAHAFASRKGGVSKGVYESLNLGLSTGDKPETVWANRHLVLEAFSVPKDRVCALQQVHSSRVVEATASWYELEADGAVTNKENLLLIISTADCVPILFYDSVRGAIGAAHAGWRGTVKGVARNVVTTLSELYSSKPEDIHTVFGPCILGDCYQVGKEVIDTFVQAGFPDTVYYPDEAGRYRLDLLAANRFMLEHSGVPSSQIHSMNLCTHCDSTRFYSHRRDGLKRGGHWSGIKLTR